MRILHSKNVFTVVAGGCALFVVLTLIAMLLYPGGNYTDLTTEGYTFTRNFFSDLGRTVSHSGQPNLPAAVLFTSALTLAGAGLVLFFLAFPRFFTQPWPRRLLSWLGSAFGVLAGVCFIGVAINPANTSLVLHRIYVMWAFRFFPLAVFCYIIAMFLNRSYPRRYAWIFVIFWALLVGYYLLLTNGPRPGSDSGLLIQAIGQKVIVYASVVSIGLEALGARQFSDSMCNDSRKEYHDGR